MDRLYGLVKQRYCMPQDKDLDKRINGLFYGLEKILSAISDMRKKEVMHMELELSELASLSITLAYL